MQSVHAVMDSLCRCFGSTPIHNDLDLESLSLTSAAADQQRSVPATPDMKRRTRSLALQDKQWDALFSADPRPSSLKGASLEQAQAVAKAKLAAHPARPRLHKRKRSTSRDDIFRSKKEKSPSTTGAAASSSSTSPAPNPLSRFLSNHPSLAHSLCFASPIRDSQEPDEFLLDPSVCSETNTLNTAEDTITSTLYYETTKLAGLEQTSPPMPLFDNYCVDERDDIHAIVGAASHSSARMRDWVRDLHVDEELEEEEEEEEATPPASPRRRHEEPPPPMTNVSSSSSSQKTES